MQLFPFHMKSKQDVFQVSTWESGLVYLYLFITLLFSCKSFLWIINKPPVCSKNPIESTSVLNLPCVSALCLDYTVCQFFCVQLNSMCRKKCAYCMNFISSVFEVHLCHGSCCMSSSKTTFRCVDAKMPSVSCLHSKSAPLWKWTLVLGASLVCC